MTLRAASKSTHRYMPRLTLLTLADKPVFNFGSLVAYKHSTLLLSDADLIFKTVLIKTSHRSQVFGGRSRLMSMIAFVLLLHRFPEAV